MPYYVNPLLKRWLRPPPDVPQGRERTGKASASSSRLKLFWVVVFYLVTRVFWHLP